MLKFGLAVFAFFLVFLAPAQEEEAFVKPKESNHYRVVFYNLENAFDPFDNPEKRDDEFLPGGERRWTERKAKEKIDRMAKVLLSVGGWNQADIIGLCELESRWVLEQLVSSGPLAKFKYAIIHQESPDRRGIDVGILYNPERVKVLETAFLPIVFPNDTGRKTRDIGYAQFLLYGRDTLHYYVNHWPSRWGGQLESEPGRMYVASVLKAHIEAIQNTHTNPYIVVMGDLNDEPKDKSVYEILHARHFTDSTSLVNLMLALEEQGQGTHKYQGKWGILDQIIVSKNLLLDNRNGLEVDEEQAYIFKAPWLLEPDERGLGEKPFRTFVGFSYNGGFSDHLPVYIDLEAERDEEF